MYAGGTLTVRRAASVVGTLVTPPPPPPPPPPLREWPWCDTQKTLSLNMNSLIGLVVKASVSIAADLGSNPVFGMDLFSKSSRASDLRIGSPVATLQAPGAGTGRHGVSIL